MATSGFGVPVKLLHESLGHIITVELKTGQLFRGKLAEAEDNLNIPLKDITVTGRDELAFKRVGSNAMRGVGGRGIGAARGRATIQRIYRGRGAAPTMMSRGIRR
ncbi:Sm-like ribonucleoprotein [Favolaschia claudopus]|uniref:Sm-like ribonucleoprotein n=1 Tax=Favolaschia claudopus TaxID=2862362 RepID=A0AAW0AVB8_9AGAR